MATEAKKITGARTAKPADKRGPKAGSAMSNQSVKLADEAKKSDLIREVKGVTSGGNYTAVSANGQKTLLIPTSQFVGNLQKLAAVGKSYKTVADLFASLPKPQAKAAQGVTGHNSPNVAKALEDQAKGSKKPTAAPKADKPASKVKAEKAAAKPTGDRKYKHLVKLADITLRPDTWTEFMVQTIMAHTSTEAASAALAKSKKWGDRKLDFKWAADARKYIAF